jgi:uracil-DNA glycosylase family 4
MALFSGSEVARVRTPLTLVPQCQKCGIAESGCQSPKMAPTGKGRKEILICSEYPGKNEDLQGVQLVGNAGRKLEQVLNRCGVRLREDCVLTNALICFPGTTKVQGKHVGFCRPNLLRTVNEVQPKVVILLGGKAIESLIGHVWKDDFGGVSRWVGWTIPYQKGGYWICPTYNPAYLCREEDVVLDAVFLQHLKAAVKLADTPVPQAPNYEDQVECLFDPVEAAARIEKLTDNNSGHVSFDYETDRLKPDHADAEIVCCSMSDGETTIAFPWSERVVEPFKRFLRSDVPKIASNLDMEVRWSRKVLRCNPRGFVGEGHDTMLDAHALDPRGKISSIKFQAFVRLGVPAWDEHVHPYLVGKGGNGKNRIREVPMEALCHYCGLDSLYEFEVAMIQRRIGREGSARLRKTVKKQSDTDNE